jgi:hypothetical protein
LDTSQALAGLTQEEEEEAAAGSAAAAAGPAAAAACLAHDDVDAVDENGKKMSKAAKARLALPSMCFCNNLAAAREKSGCRS